ncbi:KEOPS complex subunit Pcc1 [Nitrosopumilus sp.]|nr:KEOPS complex subunit Pcc1 [Nitrosopumilus sp.]MDC0330014.1 KEOPS complex subunit Pcc1 [Nitrosopumilus sp.]
MEIVLNNISKKKAETVKKALEPDNVNFPKGLSLYVENIDNKLIFNFESKENMKQLVGTVDEVLEHIQVALKVIE